MLPAVTRPGPPITGEMHVVGLRHRYGTHERRAWSAGSAQVPAAAANVELCMRDERMRRWWSRIGPPAERSGADIDGSAGE